MIDNGFSQQTITSNFSSFFIDISELTSEISITTYFTDSCPPITLTYNIVYNLDFYNIAQSFAMESNIDLCRGDTVDYFIDPDVFIMPINAEIHFSIICDSINTEVII